MLFLLVNRYVIVAFLLVLVNLTFGKEKEKVGKEEKNKEDPGYLRKKLDKTLTSSKTLLEAIERINKTIEATKEKEKDEIDNWVQQSEKEGNQTYRQILQRANKAAESLTALRTSLKETIPRAEKFPGPLRTEDVAGVTLIVAQLKEVEDKAVPTETEVSNAYKELFDAANGSSKWEDDVDWSLEI